MKSDLIRHDHTSTASSDGGLPHFGVFQNQKAYTVYLDMRVNDDDKAPFLDRVICTTATSGRSIHWFAEPESYCPHGRHMQR